MLRITWKSLLGHKLRLLLSTLSVVLGIAFVAGSLLFTNLLSASFEQIIKSAIADVNVLPGGTTQSSPGEAVPAVVLEPKVVEEIAGIAGIAEAKGAVTTSNLFPLNKEGKILAFGGSPGIASNWFTTPAADGREGARVIAGAAPASDGQVAVDPVTLERGGYKIGDQLGVASPSSGTYQFEIVGTATYGDGANAGASYLFFTDSDAQKLILNGKNVYNSVWIATEQQADPKQVAAEVAKLVPETMTVKTGDELAENVEEQLALGMSFVNTFLLVFAGIAMLVASLLILNTFSVLVMQRSRELALLRAIGATASQIRKSVLLESLIVGIFGTSLGIGLGYALTWLIRFGLSKIGIGLGSSMPALTWQILAICYLIGITVSYLAAWIPARKAAATRPVEAMSASAVPKAERFDDLTMVGLGLIQLGVAAVVCGVYFDVPQPLLWAGSGCAAILIGLVLAAAFVGSPLVWVFGLVYRVFFKEVGKLAERNSIRHPRRTAATAATLMIGLSLVTTVAILGSSTTESVRSQILGERRGDFVISPVNYRQFNSEVAQKAEKLDGVSQVWSFSITSASYKEKPLRVTGTTPAGLKSGSTIPILAGGLGETGNQVMISLEVSQDLELSLGKSFEVESATGERVELLVAGIFEEDLSMGSDVIVNPNIFKQLGDPALVRLVVVELDQQANVENVRNGLEEITKDLPTVLVTNNEEYADQLVSRFNQVFAVLYALLALAIIISVLGIVNTLGLSVMERVREIGLLRAIGVTRGQLRRMITLESVIVAVLGSTLGVLLGVLFGTVLVRLLNDSGIKQLAINWQQLGLFVLVAGIVGLLAAVFPARKAARLDILESIAVE